MGINDGRFPRMQKSVGPGVVVGGEDKALRLAGIAKESLFHFTKTVLGYSKLSSSATSVDAKGPHGALCEFLSGDGSQKLVLMPRGSFKSTIATVAYVLWRVWKDPNIRVLIASSNFQNSVKYLSEIKQHIEGGNLFRAVCGEWCSEVHAWRADEVTVKQRVVVKKEPTITASSFFQTRVGMHYDLVIMDDVVSDENTQTPEQVAKTLEKYRLLKSIMDPGSDLVIVGTRYSFSDLYGYIIDEEKAAWKVHLRSAYNEDRTLFFPEVLTKDHLNARRASQGSYLFSCNPGEADILMADWSTKRIDEVRVGDEVIGFKLARGVRKNKLVKARVLEVGARMSFVNRVHLDSGRVIRCTPDHQWYTGRRDGTHRAYAPVRVGSKMMRVVDTITNSSPSRHSGFQYLAGIIDGEGACKYGSISISQSLEKNPEVFARIKDTLNILGLPYREYATKRGKPENSFVINGGKQSKFDILRYGNPAKSGQIRGTLWAHPGQMVHAQDKVIKIEPDNFEPVYALTTETGNYICWGYASKNCQYQNNPIDQESALFRASWMRYYEEDQCPPAELMNHFMFIDPAASIKADADYTGIVVIGADWAGRKWIREALQERITVSEVIDLAFALIKRYNCEFLGFEQTSYQKMFEYAFMDEINRRGRTTPFAVKLVGVDSRLSKIKRVRGLQPEFEGGKILMKRKEHAALVDQVLRYPKVKHDDIIDALAHCIKFTYPSEEPRGSDKYVGLSVGERRVWEQLTEVRKPRYVRRTRGFRPA